MKDIYQKALNEPY